MKKQIIALSLTCACLVNASWLDDAKSKVNGAVDSAKGKYTQYNENKEKEKQDKLNKCIKEVEINLPKYALFLEQNYINSNKPLESKILASYTKLKTKDISNELQSSFDTLFIESLSSSNSNIEYMSKVIAKLNKIQKQLKKNDKSQLNNLIKQTQLLMYAWTTPMEILSSKKIYDNSLLGLSTNFYKNINKETYKNYNEFVYSMLFVNLINENVIIPKDTVLQGILKNSPLVILATGLPTVEDKKGLKVICTDIESSIIKTTSANEYIQNNISENLNIEKNKFSKIINVILENKNLYKSSIIFDKDIKQYQDVDIIDNPLNDNWYLMIREYMELQDNFYQAKKEVAKIIKILQVLPNTSKEIAILKQSSFNVDALYRKVDEIVRFNIIDLPLAIYADLYSIQVKKAKKWYDDDENKITNIAVAYNKSCANMQKYLSSEFVTLRVLHAMKTIKKELNEDEFKVAKTRAKLTQDWLNMLNKVKIQNK